MEVQQTNIYAEFINNIELLNHNIQVVIFKYNLFQFEICDSKSKLEGVDFRKYLLISSPTKCETYKL